MHSCVLVLHLFQHSFKHVEDVFLVETYRPAHDHFFGSDNLETNYFQYCRGAWYSLSLTK